MKLLSLEQSEWILATCLKIVVKVKFQCVQMWVNSHRLKRCNLLYSPEQNWVSDTLQIVGAQYIPYFQADRYASVRPNLCVRPTIPPWLSDRSWVEQSGSILYTDGRSVVQRNARSAAREARQRFNLCSLRGQCIAVSRRRLMHLVIHE